MPKARKPPNQPKLIAYKGREEVLLCLPSEETLFLKTYFQDGMVRNLSDYVRSEVQGSYGCLMIIESRVAVLPFGLISETRLPRPGEILPR